MPWGERSNACSSDDLCAVADLITARQRLPDEADAGAEAPGALADAKVEHGIDVGRPEYDREFIAFMKGIEKR